MTGYPPVVQRWFTGVSPSHATCWPLLPGPWLGLPVVTLRDAHCVLLTGIIVPRTADFFMNFVGCGTVMVMIPGEMADSVTALRAQGGVRAEGAGRLAGRASWDRASYTIALWVLHVCTTWKRARDLEASH